MYLGVGSERVCSDGHAVSLLDSEGQARIVEGDHHLVHLCLRRGEKSNQLSGIPTLLTVTGRPAKGKR
jgi:hypothetical protein